MDSVTDRTWIWFAAALYLAGFVIGTIGVIRERRHSRALLYFIVSAAFTLQTFGLYLRGLQVKGCPIGNTFEIFQFTAWSATALYLVIGATFRVSLLGYFTSCLTATLTLVSLLIPGWDAEKRINIFGGNGWIEFHAALALFSYGVFALLALTSVMYLLQVFSLQRRHLHGLFSFLPSVIDLDHISLRLLTAGVVLMSASLAVGSVYWLRDTSTVDSPKLLITVAIWVAYVATLALRAKGVLIAKRFAWACVALFAAALLSLGPVSSSRNNPPAASAALVR